MRIQVKRRGEDGNKNRGFNVWVVFFGVGVFTFYIKSQSVLFLYLCERIVTAWTITKAYQPVAA